MAFDLGPNSKYPTPTETEKAQVRKALGISVEFKNVSTATYTLSTSDLDRFVRMTYVGGESKELTIPVYGENFLPVEGSLISIRNSSESNNLTLIPEGLITLNKASGAEIITPMTTAQILYIGDNTWDLL